MSDTTAGTEWVTWGVASRPLPGAPESGDQYWIRCPPGSLEVAVADGLGHSTSAAAAARAALSALEGSTVGDPLEAVLRRAHDAARNTRGAVMSVVRCRLGCGTLTWLGVGNVQAALFSEGTAGAAVPKASLLMRGGVVGHRLPSLHATTVSVAPGDVLVLATDGLCSEWSRTFTLWGTPQEMADRALAAHVRPTDDALVLVARFAERGV